jgi:hypothetical protein
MIVIHEPTVTSAGDSPIADAVVSRLRSIIEDVTRNLEARPAEQPPPAGPPAPQSAQP